MAKRKAKKNKFILPIVLVMIVVAVGAVVLYTDYIRPSSAIANPASTKCQSDGGQEKIIDGLLGQSGLCMFPDGSVCDEWAYYRGECSKGSCKRTCDRLGTRSEGWYDCNGNLLFYDNCTGEDPATAGTC
jgi:putative hemolysin